MYFQFCVEFIMRNTHSGLFQVVDWPENEVLVVDVNSDEWTRYMSVVSKIILVEGEGIEC